MAMPQTEDLDLNLELATTDLKGMARLTAKLWDYLKSPELWDAVMVGTVKIMAILILSWAVVAIGKKVIKNVFTLRMRAPLSYSERRQTTILKLLQSVLSYIVYFSAIMAILSVLNIQIAGLLAGAGIAGLAIGFGAQSLVKDIITGFFIIFEDQFGVGDYIKLNAAEGTVIEIGLRTTKIKGNTGEQFIIPNGLITDVINYSVNNAKGSVDMQVALNANIEKVEKVIQHYLDVLPEQHEELVVAPKFVGVVNTTPTEATIRITVETLPLQQHAVMRVIRRDVIDILQKNGVPLSAPRRMVWDRNGMEDE